MRGSLDLRHTGRMSESTPPPVAPDEDETDDPQANYGVAIAFFFVGIALLIGEGTRWSGLPFLILALVFFLTASRQAQQQTPDDEA